MMPLNNPLIRPLILGTLTSFLAVSYGSITDTRLFRLKNDKKNLMEIETKFRGESLSDAIKLEAIAGSITQKGFFAFDLNNNDTYKTADMDSQHLLMHAKLQRMGPAVQCTEDAMTLRLKGGKAPHFLIDNGDGSLTPLTQMPSQCGFFVKRSRRDVLFVAPYQGCHVTEQAGDHVLHLKLWGKSMKMSCPLASTPPSVSCFINGMVLNMGNIAAAVLHVEVSDVWEPLLLSGEPCGFVVESNSRELIIKAPYTEPCITLKDEDHVLVLLVDDQELTVSCPSIPTTLDGVPATSPADPQMLTTNSPVPTADPSDLQSPYAHFLEFLHFPWFRPFFPTTDSTRVAPADRQMLTTKTTASTTADLPDATDSDSKKTTASTTADLPDAADSDSQSAELPPYSWFPRYRQMVYPGAQANATTTSSSDPEAVELPLNPQNEVFTAYMVYPRMSLMTSTTRTTGFLNSLLEKLSTYPWFSGIPPYPGFFSPFPLTVTTSAAPTDPQMPTTNNAAPTPASLSEAWTPEQPPFPGFLPHSGFFYFPGVFPNLQFPTTDTTKDSPVDVQIPTTRTSAPTAVGPSDPESAELPLYPQSPRFPPYPGGYLDNVTNTKHLKMSPTEPQKPTSRTDAPSTEAPPDPESAELPLISGFPLYPRDPRPFPVTATLRDAPTDPQTAIAANSSDAESVTLFSYTESQSDPGFPLFSGFLSYLGFPSHPRVPRFPGFLPDAGFSRQFPITATTTVPSTSGSSDPQMPERSPYHHYPGFPHFKGFPAQSGFHRSYPMTSPTKAAPDNPEIPTTKFTAASTAGSHDPELAELPPYPRFTRFSHFRGFPRDAGFPRRFPLTANTRALAGISDLNIPKQPSYLRYPWLPKFHGLPGFSRFPRPLSATAPMGSEPNDPQMRTTKTYAPTTRASGWITAAPYKPSNSKWHQHSSSLEDI